MRALRGKKKSTAKSLLWTGNISTLKWRNGQFGRDLHSSAAAAQTGFSLKEFLVSRKDCLATQSENTIYSFLLLLIGMYWGAPNVILHMAKKSTLLFKRETLQHPFRARVSRLNFFSLKSGKKIQMATINSKVLRDLTELYDQKKVQCVCQLRELLLPYANMCTQSKFFCITKVHDEAGGAGWLAFLGS